MEILLVIVVLALLYGAYYIGWRRGETVTDQRRNRMEK
jgi:hypothetical protein